MSYIQFYHLEQFVDGLDPLFRDESDRGAAVVAACFLEDFIGDVLGHYADLPLLHPRHDPKFKKGSFADHIDRMRRKELVDAAHVAHFHFIRDLRNIFAHNLRAATFRYPGVAAFLREHLGNVDDDALKQAFVAVLKDCTAVLVHLSVTKFQATKQAQFAHLNQVMVAERILHEIDNGEVIVTFVEIQEGNGLYTTDQNVQFLMRLEGKKAVGVLAIRVGVGAEWEAITPERTMHDTAMATWASKAFPAAE